MKLLRVMSEQSKNFKSTSPRYLTYTLSACATEEQRDGIGATMRLEHTIGTLWRALAERRPDKINELVGQDQRPVCSSMDIPQCECVVAHLREHPALVRGEYAAIAIRRVLCRRSDDHR